MFESALSTQFLGSEEGEMVFGYLEEVAPAEPTATVGAGPELSCWKYRPYGYLAHVLQIATPTI